VSLFVGSPDASAANWTFPSGIDVLGASLRFRLIGALASAFAIGLWYFFHLDIV